MADVSPRSSLLKDVSQGGTSATQRQKFHTDDVNQCLHNKSGSHRGSKCKFVQFYVSPGRFFLSFNKSKMLLLEKTLFHKY